MSVASEADPPLTLSSLVVLDQDVEPYVLQWPALTEEDGMLDIFVVAVMKRQDGVLLAVPHGVLSEDDLRAGNLGGEGVLGLSRTVMVPSVILDGGVVNKTAEDIDVVLVDCSADIVAHLRHVQPFEEIAYGFDLDSPFALPDPQATLAAALDWIRSVEPQGDLAFYTAEDVDGTEPPLTPSRPKRRAKAKAVPGRSGSLEDRTGEPHLPVREKAKRATTATLAAQLDSLMSALPGLSSQVQELARSQRELEAHVRAPVTSACPALQQPLYKTVQGPALAPSTVARSLSSPPRTAAPLNAPGILRSPEFHQPLALNALEKEKSTSQPALTGDHLAQAVLVQSQALTSLVNQIAQGQSDPLVDLGGTTSTGTRGTAGRVRLQTDLASQKGLFFQAVMQAMARRMSPTLPVEGSYQQLMEKGVCGTRYLERFGGYGRHRDLGQLQYQVMQAMDYLQVENIQAARDTLALLAVTIEQAVMDNGKFDFASVLCLQDDLPSSIFLNRNAGSLSRSRSFSPLADQKWITVALAYLKELDTIQTKRAEFVGGNPKATSTASPAPKPKGTPKRKGKGKGGHNQTPAQQDEEEA